MNGQGPNNQQGFTNTGVPQRPPQPKPRFNFNNRDVKKEITPDFMAAQLASFGSSAKLKSLPSQIPDQTNTFSQQPYPAGSGFQQMPIMGFQQFNPVQGFRQPMMAPPMSFQNQSMNPSVNIAPQGMYNTQGNMAMQMPRGNMMNTAMFNQFSMQTNMRPNIQTNMQHNMPTNMGMPHNRFQAPPINAMNSSVNSIPVISTFQPSSSNSPSGVGDMFDIFNKASTATQSGKASGAANDPFSNLRGSTQPIANQGTSMSQNPPFTVSAFPAQKVRPNSNRGTLDVFGNKPFKPASTPVVQPPTQTGLMNFRSDFNPQISSSNSMMTAHSKQSSASKQSATALPVLSSSGFVNRGNNFSTSLPSSNSLSSEPTLFPPSPATSLTFGNDFNPPPNKPIENRDLFNQASKSEPKNSDMFGQVPFTVEPKKSDSFAGAFARKDSQLDIFGPPLSTKVDSFKGAESTISTDLFGQTKQSILTEPQSVNLFDSVPFSTEATKTSSNVSNVVDSSDKYSVFSALQSSETIQEQDPNFAPFDSEPVYSVVSKSAPPPPAPFHAEVPLSFPADGMFGDAFDPFGASKPKVPEAVSYDVFDQLSSRPDNQNTVQIDKKGSTSQSNSGMSSIIRERPSTKTPSTMILLPPPTKAAERKRTGPPSLPPRHDAPAFDPFVNKGDFSSTRKESFDPFAVETDGASLAKLGTAKSNKGSGPPPKPPPSYSTSHASKPAPLPPRPSSKRPAPPPPVRKDAPSRSSFFSDGKQEEKKDIPSLLDLDFSLPAAPTPAKPPQPQPLLILPACDTKKAAPPARPPPPKTGVIEAEGPTRSLFDGLPPPLPPRPAPGHKLYHYMMRTGPHAVALFDFEAENDDELDFKVGETIKLIADFSAEWYSGSVGTNQGIFPKNLVMVKIKLIPDGSTITTTDWATDSAPAPITWTPVPQSEPAAPVDPFNAWGDAGTPSPPSPPSSPVNTSKPNLEPTITSSVFDTPLSKSVFDTPAVTRAAVSSATRTERETCVAVYTFGAQEPDELDVKEGDTIEVIEHLEGDWVRGKIGDRTGIFPKSYASFGDEDITEDIEEIIEDATHSVNVFYDFQSDQTDELDLTAGDMVVVLGVAGQEWLRGRCNGKEGIFPTCFVPVIPPHWNLPNDSETFTESFETTEETSDSSSDNETSDAMSIVSEASTSHEELGRVQAIADFVAENDFEMSVKQGDVVSVTAKLNELWLEGECNGNTGIFPVNFVKWLDHGPQPILLSNPLVSDEVPGLLRQETLTGLPLPLPRQDTLTVLPDQDLTPRKHPQTEDLTPRSQQDTALSPTFSMSNPFAGNSSPFPGDSDSFTPQPETLTVEEDDRNKTLISPENPFTETFSTENSESPISPVSPEISKNAAPAPGDKMTALYAFLPDNEDELVFEEGDEIVVTEYINEEWLKGRCKGKEGLFPTSYANR